MSKSEDRVYHSVQQIHEALQRELRRRRGTVGEVEKAMGVKPGYWRGARSRGTLDGVALLKALDLLGIDPGQFFFSALGTVRTVGPFEAEFIRRAPGGVPEVFQGKVRDEQK